MCGKGSNRTHCEHSNVQDGHLFPLVPLVIQSCCFFFFLPMNQRVTFDLSLTSEIGHCLVGEQRYAEMMRLLGDQFLVAKGEHIGKHKSK